MTIKLGLLVLLALISLNACCPKFVMVEYSNKDCEETDQQKKTP